VIQRMWFALLLVPLLGCPGAQDGGAQANDNGASRGPPFSGDSAFAYVQKQVSFGPRVTGMPGHKAQLEWMQQHLSSRADTVLRQDFVHTHTRNGVKLALTNLFARFNVNAPQRILLVAHWDTRPTADNEDDEEKRQQPIQGANDGASGTAVLLHLADILKRNPPPIGVDLLFVDGEDYGPDGTDMYLGATYFAANLPRGYKPLYGILLDMIGDHQPVYAMEGNSQEYAPEVLERVWRLAETLNYANHFPRRSIGGISDDHLPLSIHNRMWLPTHRRAVLVSSGMC
jgi:glutaminyl-peptide cyclotransferase